MPARGSARVTRGKPPNPRSWRRPRIRARCVKNPTLGTGFTSAVPQTQSNSARFVVLRATVPTGSRRSLASAPLPVFDARRDGSHSAVWRFPCRPPAAGLCRPEVYTLRTSFSGPSGVRGTEGPYFTNLLADPPGATNRRHVFRTPTPDCASTDLGRDGTHRRRAAPSSSQYRPQRTSRRLTSP